MTKETADNSIGKLIEEYQGKWVKSFSTNKEFLVKEIYIDEIGLGNNRYEIFARLGNTLPEVKIKATELPVNWLII